MRKILTNAIDDASDPESKIVLATETERSSSRILKTVGRVSVVALSLLSFPSVLPWMIAFWITCHTTLVRWNRPAWVPLAICLCILIVKLVALTPAMITMMILLAIVTAIRFRDNKRSIPKRRWWTSPVVLWIAWIFLFLEWRWIECCNQPLILDATRPIVCLGDSLTEGMHPDRGFPEPLKSMVRVPVINLGFSGISTTQGLAQMKRVLGHHPQVVVIELGGHDFLKRHGRATAKRNLLAMIQQCRSNDADVILMEIPRGFIFDPYASLEREIAYEQDVQLVSDTWLRQIVLLGPAAPPGIWMPEYRLSDDGIHSNPRGSQAIAKHVAAALQMMYGDSILKPDAPLKADL